MSHYQIRPLIALTLLVFIAAGVYGTAHRASAQTVPTRTPTPEPGGGDSPTATPDDGDDGEPGPAPTSTDEPQGTATATSEAVVVTPEGGALPTADACSTEPTVQARIGSINVRGGPGTDYDVVGELELLEVRPIVGRAQDVAWWQISLEGNIVGWVADDVVSVSGYTGLVPTIDAPALPDGSTPTPGSPWSPTPRPDCTPPAPTETPTATPTATPTSDEGDEPQSAAPSGGGSEDAATSTTTPTVEPSATPTATATPEEVAEEIAATETPAPLPAEASTGGSSIPWLPIIGLVLILAAAALFVLRRGAA
ncbi:MAG: SH3 domain-containing protein [Chloroflexota bacterium]